MSRQAATGSYTTKRAASLLKRLALLEEQHAAAISKAVQLEAAKMGRLGSDGMEAGGAGWTLLCDVLNTAQQSRNTVAHGVMTEVVVPLLEYYGDAEDKRRELVAEERKATLDMGRQAEEVQRGLAATVKLLQTARQQMQHEMDSGSVTKTLTKHFRQSVKQTTAHASRARGCTRTASQQPTRGSSATSRRSCRSSSTGSSSWREGGLTCSSRSCCASQTSRPQRCSSSSLSCSRRGSSWQRSCHPPPPSQLTSTPPSLRIRLLPPLLPSPTR